MRIARSDSAMILFLETSCTWPAAKARNSTDTFLTADRVGTENSRARARERELEEMAGQRRTIAETVQHTRTRRAKSDSARASVRRSATDEERSTRTDYFCSTRIPRVRSRMRTYKSRWHQVEGKSRRARAATCADPRMANDQESPSGLAPPRRALAAGI